MKTDSKGRTTQDREHLDLLRSLAGEIDKAVVAISRNRLAEFEESICQQESLAWQLSLILKSRAAGFDSASIACRPVGSEVLRREFDQARQSLQQSCQIYAAVLRHASHSCQLTLSLFDSRRGNFQEASGARRRHQTWSGQM